jgi:hypothetical protein
MSIHTSTIPCDCPTCCGDRHVRLLREAYASGYQSGRVDAGDSSYGNGFVGYYLAACQDAGGYASLRKSWRAWQRVHEVGEMRDERGRDYADGMRGEE